MFLSIQNNPLPGNDTIDHYPPLESLALGKVLIIKEELFKLLKQEFSIFQKLYKKKLKKSTSVNEEKRTRKEPINKKRIYPQYEPSNIIYALESDPWRWRRVNEWFKYYAQEND